MNFRLAVGIIILLLCSCPLWAQSATVTVTIVPSTSSDLLVYVNQTITLNGVNYTVKGTLPITSLGTEPIPLPEPTPIPIPLPVPDPIPTPDPDPDPDPCPDIVSYWPMAPYIEEVIHLAESPFGSSVAGYYPARIIGANLGASGVIWWNGFPVPSEFWSDSEIISLFPDIPSEIGLNWITIQRSDGWYYSNIMTIDPYSLETDNSAG